MVLGIQATGLPPVKRLGFDDGWARFGSTFLNFGRPSIFIDSCYLPEAALLGFESFATWPGDDPLPRPNICALVLGSNIRLHSATSGNLLASHRYEVARAEPLSMGKELVVFVGDSWALSLSWSALWRSVFGYVKVCDANGTKLH